MKTVKPCYFVGPSKRALSDMPDDVKTVVGVALFEAQTGGESVSAKALKGFGGRGVLEVVENHDGDTFRAVYTVRFSTGIYVLHAFQKKSKSGIATPKHELDVVASRLKDAEILHRHYLKEGQ